MSKLGSKRILVVAVAVAALGGGGAAIAASEGGSGSPTAFLDSVARHLGVSSERLQDATKAAALEQVDAAREAGRITEEQAEELRSRIESGEFPHFRGLGLFRGPGLHGPGQKLEAAAEYLDLSVAELRDRLASGKSLADVAEAQDKSVDGLKEAILGDAEQRLDEAVNDGRLTRDQADAMLDRLEARIDDIVNGTLRHRWRGGGRPYGPSDGPGLWRPAA